jgi:hypothetical protein
MEAIDALLDESLSVPEFRRRYYDYYVDVLPEWALTDKQRQFFGAAQEKLDWVDDDPDAESRRAGWVGYREFIAWLRDWRDSFPQ